MSEADRAGAFCPQPSNRGAEISLVVSVDWLEFSVKDMPVGKVERVLGSYVVGDYLEVERGMLGYERQKVGPGGSRILSTARKKEVHVILPGDWCGGLSKEEMGGLLAWVDVMGKVSRCDLAGDDWRRLVRPVDVREAVRRGELVSHGRKRQWLEEMGTDQGTAYFGAPSSRQRVRVYDKTEESGGAIDAVRWELQLRDKAGESVVPQLWRGNWGEVWASRLVQLVDFRDRSRDALVNRCPRMEWFEGIVGDAEKATWYEPRPVTSAEKADNWLHRQVAPILAAMVVRNGGDIEYLGELMRDGRVRWKTKHRLLAEGEFGQLKEDYEMVGNTEGEAEKGFDLAKFADFWQRFPFEWPGLQADTWVWCLHCQRCFRFIDSKLDDEGLLVCAYTPDCDASALDFWAWSKKDWEEKGDANSRPQHWPEVPEVGKVYPLYA